MLQFMGKGQLDPGTTRAEAEAKYVQSQYMLTNLGLQKYHRNIKNGLLTDDTIMLWNETALTECRIPPGPRYRLCLGFHFQVLASIVIQRHLHHSQQPDVLS